MARGITEPGRWGVRVTLTFICLAFLTSHVGSEETDTSAGEDVSEVRVSKSPRGAMLRSLALPGWGQFYNGRLIKGSLIAAAETASVVAFFVRRNQLADQVNPVGAPPKRNIYLFTTIGVLFLSGIDAYVDAHLDSVDWGDFGEESAGARLWVGKRFRVADYALRIGGWYEPGTPGLVRRGAPLGEMVATWGIPKTEWIPSEAKRGECTSHSPRFCVRVGRQSGSGSTGHTQLGRRPAVD